MSTNPIPLQLLSENGWKNGFASLLRKENHAWSSSLRWLRPAIIWLGLLNGLLGFMLFAAPSLGAPPVGLESVAAQGLALFFSLLFGIGSLGVVIVAHDKIAGEKQAGTAAWILSKPVSRAAFILSKLISGSIHIFIFLIVLPGLVAYGEISLAAHQPIAALPFVASLVVAFAALLFYLTLSLVLGTFFQQRSIILGFAFGILFGMQIVSPFVPQLASISPISLSSVAVTLAQGQALTNEAILPIFFTLLWSAIFIGLALWRFERDEF